MKNEEMPDFMSLVNAYQSLSKGQKAEIRRAPEPEALLDIPAFYHFIGRAKLKPDAQSCRIAWFLPHVKHQEQSETLGQIMKKKDVKERRLFQIVRSEYPNDLIQLQRIMKYLKVSLDWKGFGRLLYYWGQSKEGSKPSKRRLMQDYYLYNERNEN